MPRQRTAGGPPPARHPLPSFPARHPARSGPYLPALRLPGRPARCGRLGEWAGGAGGRAVDGGLPGPGHGAPDLGATPSREAREGRRGSRGRRGAGRGGGRSRRSLRSQSAAPRRGPCCPAAHLGVRSSGLPLAGGGVLLRVSRFRRSPTPPRGRWAQLLPPRPPGPVAVTLAAPAQRPPSAHPAPSGLQCDPWRLGGPLAPKQLLTTPTMLQDTNPAAPQVQGDPSQICKAGLGEGPEGLGSDTQVAAPTSRFRAHCSPFAPKPELSVLFSENDRSFGKRKRKDQECRV